jgi:hypothetical protein
MMREPEVQIGNPGDRFDFSGNGSEVSAGLGYGLEGLEGGGGRGFRGGAPGVEAVGTPTSEGLKAIWPC